MNSIDRPLAITDLETTGLDPAVHDIIEIGLVLVKQSTLETISEWSIKIKPEKMQFASAEALQVNGYNEADWAKAVKLKPALFAYRKKTENAIFVAHNTTFDWSFLYIACLNTELNLLMDYHRIDLFSIAWSKLHLDKLNLSALCEHFGIAKESEPHRALTGAQKALEVLRKLKEL